MLFCIVPWCIEFIVLCCFVLCYVVLYFLHCLCYVLLWFILLGCFVIYFLCFFVLFNIGLCYAVFFYP